MLKFNDLSAQWNEVKYECFSKIHEFLEKGEYSTGYGNDIIKNFEYEFSDFIEVEYALAVNNGASAIITALNALNLNNNRTAVIVPTNTYAADAFVASHLGYNLILLDNNEYYQIDVKLLHEWLELNTHRYKNVVLLLTHMYGIPCDMKRILELKEKYHFYIIEDCSHAHGSVVRGRKVGSIGDIGVFSLYAGKALGAAGEAGIITTNNAEYYERMLYFISYGCGYEKYSHKTLGLNYRINALQCIILKEKLKFLPKWNKAKQDVAGFYSSMLIDYVQIPKIPKGSDWISWYVYPIRVQNRDNIVKYLKEKDIPTIIHYPNPIHKLAPYKLYNGCAPLSEKYSKQLLSLPLHPYLTDEELDKIYEALT